MRHLTVYSDPYHYSAWPAICRTPDGTLLVSFCNTEEHLAPDGDMLVVRSTDSGETWSSPVVARNSLVDDRDCGSTALADGRVLLHVWSTHHTVKAIAGLNEESYERHVIDHWERHVSTREYLEASGLHGGWTVVSDDAGLTWKLIGRGPDSVHGGTQLPGGDIIVAGYRTHTPDIGIYRAHAEDLNWDLICLYRTPEVRGVRFGEPHVVSLESGRVIMMIRSTAVPYNDEGDSNYLWVTYSDDGGETWADASRTDLWGFPPHLLRLRDGRVVCSYGYRRHPYGQRACVSEDGITWDARREVVLRDDADSGDLGYPASVELDSGEILTVYYQAPHTDPPARMQPPDPLRHKPDILGTIWNP